jgi:hypothetical protein
MCAPVGIPCHIMNSRPPIMDECTYVIAQHAYCGGRTRVSILGHSAPVINFVSSSVLARACVFKEINTHGRTRGLYTTRIARQHRPEHLRHLCPAPSRTFRITLMTPPRHETAPAARPRPSPDQDQVQPGGRSTLQRGQGQGPVRVVRPQRRAHRSVDVSVCPIVCMYVSLYVHAEHIECTSWVSIPISHNQTHSNIHTSAKHACINRHTRPMHANIHTHILTYIHT